MKIRFAKNIDALTGDSVIEPEEAAGNMGIERIKELTKDAIVIAVAIFKNHPEFKQVTLDTTTDEERKMLERALKTDNKN